MLVALCLNGAQAQDLSTQQAPPPPPPSPLGVLGADMPKAGGLVVSIIPQFVMRATNLIGTTAVSSQQIVSTTPWYFDPTKVLRGVPQVAFQSTQNVSLAYGVTPNVSIFLVTGMMEKNLEFLTFSGVKGVTPLGFSNTGTDSLADTLAMTVVKVYEDPIHRVQFNLGMWFPTGSDHNTFTLLQANATYLTSRAFYAMQIGTGTFDVTPGALYAGHLNQWSWGLSYTGRFPLAANPEGYRYGDLHDFNGWLGYTILPGLTATARVNGNIQGIIRGFDPNISGKAEASNPNFYGGKRIEIFGGATLSGKIFGYDNVSLAFEGGAPVYQDLNGPQLSKKWQAGMALRFKI
jgi:hypothetical protein